MCVWCVCGERVGHPVHLDKGGTIVVWCDVDIVRCSLDWPVRTLSFSYDGRMLASASEDLVIDIADVDTGQCATNIGHSISVSSP